MIWIYLGWFVITRMFFPDELPGLPLHKDVDFVIELHPGTSPISKTPHRIAPFELQELKV